MKASISELLSKNVAMKRVTSTLAKNKFVLILVYIIHAVVYNFGIKNFLEGSHFFSQFPIKKSIPYNN